MSSPTPDILNIRQIVRDCAANGHASRGVEIYDVGTDAYIDFLEREILDGFICKGGSTCRFFQGEPGSGKTHILRLIESCALRLGYAVAWVELGILTSLQEWDKITKDVVSKIAIQRKGVQIEGIEEILDYYARRSRPISNLPVRHPCYRNAMQIMLNCPEKDSQTRTLVGNYLRGEKVTITEFKQAKVSGVKKSLTQRNAESVLLTLLNCLSSIGVENDPIPGVVLIFDEADNTWSKSSPQKLRITANYIRRFIDASKNGDMHNTLAAFGVLHTFHNGSKHYPALHQRIDSIAMGDGRIPWRYPVLPVGSVNSTFLRADNSENGRQYFLEDACDKFVGVGVQCGLNAKGLRDELMKEGKDVLDRNKGTEYRRELVKRLMGHLSRHLDT